MFLRKPLQFLFCLCLFATQCSGLDKTAAAPSKSKNEDERITKINITDLDGHPVDMKAFAGKPVFMNFWATWCKPCVEELPCFDELSEIYGTQNIQILLVSLDFKSQLQKKLTLLKIG